jgi:site-specific recombinase XerD
MVGTDFFKSAHKHAKVLLMGRYPLSGHVRECLTGNEVERQMKAARGGRYGHRDATLILVAYRHGLRASEIADLE